MSDHSAVAAEEDTIFFVVDLFWQNDSRGGCGGSAERAMYEDGAVFKAMLTWRNVLASSSCRDRT